MRAKYILMWLLFMTAVAQAQILDDTTKQIYGPSSTRFRLENDLYHNRPERYAIDTAITAFHDHKLGINSGQGPYYRDLGNIGTALQPWFFQLPSNIGIQHGMDAYSPYAFAPGQIKYYDTQSPFSYFNYSQGSRGRQLFNAGISRNITPLSNIGADFQRVSSEKQIGPVAPNDEEADGRSVAVHGNFISKNNKYYLLANFTNFNHRVFETGGIYPKSGDTRDSLFDYELERVRLSPNSVTRTNRNQWHVYQQYSIDSIGHLQFFYTFDRLARSDSYSDTKTNDTTFYRNMYYKKDTTNDVLQYTLYENKGGIKGRLRNIDYAAYLFRRDFSLTNKYIHIPTRTSETYGGGYLRYQFSDSAIVHSEALYMPGRDYKIKAWFRNKWGEAGFENMRYAPTMVQNNLASNHFKWTNNFDFTTANRIYGRLDIGKGNLLFAPMAEYTYLSRYIYYDAQALPQQHGSGINVLVGGGDLRFFYKKLFVDNFYRFTHVQGPDLLRVPKHFLRSRVYIQSFLFKGALLGQFGLDVTVWSAYKGKAYMPATQQFYLQDDFMVNSYASIDPFLNARIKRVRVYVKLTNANDRLFQTGYFAAPYYPGQRRTLEFGFSWLFFD